MPIKTSQPDPEPSFTGRFYCKDTEQIVRTVIGKNGQERPVRVSDMKDHNLAPSVTTVLKNVSGYDLFTAEEGVIRGSSEALRLGRELTDKEVLGISLGACIDSSEAQLFGTKIHEMHEKISEAPPQYEPDVDPDEQLHRGKI